MNENNSRIDYLEFAVRDVGAAKKFYSAVFGWSFTDYGPEYASFHDGRLAGGFRTADGEFPASTSPVLVVLFANDLEKSEAAVKSAGGKISKLPYEFPGGRRFHFIDPNGLELAVWSDGHPDGLKIS